MSDFIVRKLTEKDISGILELEQSLATAPHWHRQDYELCLSEEEDRLTRIALVLETGGILAGFAVAVQLAGEAELESICVAAEKQGKGAGAKLLSAILEELRKSGIDRVFLEVRPSNAAAIALYRRLGFVSVGRRPRYYSSPVEDAIHMQRDL